MVYGIENFIFRGVGMYIIGSNWCGIHVVPID